MLTWVVVVLKTLPYVSIERVGVVEGAVKRGKNSKVSVEEVLPLLLQPTFLDYNRYLMSITCMLICNVTGCEESA